MSLNPLTYLKEAWGFIENVVMAKHYKEENEKLKKEVKKLKTSNSRLQKLLK